MSTGAHMDGAAQGAGPGVAASSGGTMFPVGARQRTALISWAAFAATFAGVRALTHAMKAGVIPGVHADSGGVHLHHYLWGIALLAASGGLAIHGNDRLRANPAVAAGYGAGAALVVVEMSSRNGPTVMA